jgi:hypothetical protein
MLGQVSGIASRSVGGLRPHHLAVLQLERAAVVDLVKHQLGLKLDLAHLLIVIYFLRLL